MSVDGEKMYVAQTRVPYGMISAEVEGLFGSYLLAQFAEIMRYYDIYEHGAAFMPADVENANDIRSKQAATLIDKQARFMFAAPPDITIQIDKKKVGNAAAIQDVYQSIIDKVRKETKFDQKLLKAAKDCFIGRRVAYTVNFDDKTGKINISFVPSLGFVYETDEYDTDIITKLIIFYATNNAKDKSEQRFYKKKHEMVNGKCVITEGLYNGLGEVVEEKPEIKTNFEYIPGGVILNGGLTGDLLGESDIAKIAELEECYNKMSSKDLDAENKNMNPIIYAIDMSEKSTKDLPMTAGSFWDLATDANQDNPKSEIGTIEPKMEYSTPLATTLDRIKATTFEILDIPDVSAKAMQGVVSSGKTLKAIYWGLMVRCDEKFQEWKNAIEHITRTIIDGCMQFEKAKNRYTKESLQVVEYDILVENNYPIQEDINEEKEMDLQEVHNGVRSKKSYMKKYLDMSDEDVEEELQQMARERQMQENSFGFLPPNAGQQRTHQQTPTFNELLNKNSVQTKTTEIEVKEENTNI